MGPADLHDALQGLPARIDPNFLYGSFAGDDAGVYRLREDLAIVQTVDFFTPIVDDPFLYGQIAAANSLSDCYTIGARPLTVLNLVAYPTRLGMEALRRILEGGAEKVKEAGAVVVGGHSILDEEPKYGLMVTGVVDPRRMVTNRGARPGDKLILTKKLGTGIITQVRKQGSQNGQIPEATYEEAVASMCQLNAKTSQVMVEVGVGACTDVTGFGLVGHLHNLLEASGARGRVRFGEVPAFEGILSFALQGLPGGGRRNREWAKGYLELAAGVDEAMVSLLSDPQTSGGLLMAVRPEKAELLLSRLHAEGIQVARIFGEVEEGRPGTVCVAP